MQYTGGYWLRGQDGNFELHCQEADEWVLGEQTTQQNAFMAVMKSHRPSDECLCASKPYTCQVELCNPRLQSLMDNSINIGDADSCAAIPAAFMPIFKDGGRPQYECLCIFHDRSHAEEAQYRANFSLRYVELHQAQYQIDNIFAFNDRPNYLRTKHKDKQLRKAFEHINTCRSSNLLWF